MMNPAAKAMILSAIVGRYIIQLRAMVTKERLTDSEMLKDVTDMYTSSLIMGI